MPESDFLVNIFFVLINATVQMYRCSICGYDKIINHETFECQSVLNRLLNLTTFWFLTV